MDWMPDLSEADALREPGVSRSAAKVSAPSPEAEFDVDLFVIGGGSGGVRAARRRRDAPPRAAAKECGGMGDATGGREGGGGRGCVRGLWCAGQIRCTSSGGGRPTRARQLLTPTGRPPKPPP